MTSTWRRLRGFLPQLSSRSHITVGLSFLLLSVVLLAMTFGLVPDRAGAVREGRAALAETIAANSSAFLTHADLRRLEATLRLAVERNDDILSAAARRADGEAIVIVGDHERHWSALESDYSTDSQIQVPIWSADGQWGRIELRAQPLTRPGWQGKLENPRMRLAGFLTLTSFLLFYLYLGKTLRHLDPSSAVPQHVRSALDTLAEGLLVIDQHEQIVLANQALATILGKKPEELVGRRCAELGWRDPRKDAAEGSELPWTRALREGVIQKNEMLLLDDADCQARTFIVNCSPVLGSGGEYGGALISLDDVTLLEESKQALVVSMEQAEAANRAKSDFLANMSHEIRTPMNAILGFTEVLKRGFGQTEAQRRKHLDTIESSGKHLLELINDILDISKIESGCVELEMMRVAPHELVHSVITILTEMARNKGLELIFEVEGRIPESVLTDPTRLRQIVTNLVSNAIKFTTEGSVTLRLRHEAAAEGDMLLIDIADTGIGIVPEKLDTIFEAFTQADSSVTRQFGGTGLGLSISRQFAGMLGGDITVTSHSGEGSVFTVRVSTGPLDDVLMITGEDVLKDDLDTDDQAQQRWTFRASRVLVVDDGPEIRELIALVLGDAGIEVEQAENGRLGVEAALKADYDLILMDMQMPVMDGYTAARTLREKGLEVPIFALTANAMTGFEAKCLAAGCTRFMTKPIDIDLLLATMAEFLDGQRVAADAAPAQIAGSGLDDAPQPDRDQAQGATGVPYSSTPATTAPAAGEQNAPDPATPSMKPVSAGPPLRSRLPLRNPRILAAVTEFVRRLEMRLGEMRTCYYEGDMEALKSLGHWLKGSGGTVGFDAFTEPAKRLEELAQAGDGDGLDAVLTQIESLVGRIDLPRPPAREPAAETSDSGPAADISSGVIENPRQGEQA